MNGVGLEILAGTRVSQLLQVTTQLPPPPPPTPHVPHAPESTAIKKKIRTFKYIIIFIAGTVSQMQLRWAIQSLLRKLKFNGRKRKKKKRKKKRLTFNTLCATSNSADDKLAIVLLSFAQKIVVEFHQENIPI